MSIKVMTWAWEQELPPLTKLVLMAIADHCDDEGYAWPGIKGISKKCGVAHRTVQRQVEELQAKGILKVEARQRPDGSSSSNGYTVVLNGTIRYEGVSQSHPPMSESHPGVTEESSLGDSGDTPLTVIEPSEETTTTNDSIAKSLADALPKVMESVRNLPPIKNQLEGEMPDLRDKVTLDSETGRSWQDVADAQLQAQHNTDTKPLTLLELFNEPEWLKTLADVVRPDQKQVIRIRKWARNHDEAVLNRVGYSVAEMWDIYKTKNKSIYATFMNWVRMEEDRVKKRAVSAGVLPRSQQDRYGAEAYIQNQGLHPSSEQAKKIRREWSNGVREST